MLDCGPAPYRSARPAVRPRSPVNAATQRYRLERRIGAGRFSEVFLARDRITGERVALKRARGDDPGAAEAFAEEFARVAPLDHPGIARALDLGRDPATGRPFLVFEAIEGTRSLHACRASAPERMWGWAAGVAETLDFVHGSGLIHGDVKPEHVFILETDRPKLIDFGLARRRGTGGGGSATTAAPEVLSGGEADPRSDLFSLGATVYRWLYGRYPAGETLEDRLRSLDAEPEIPSTPRLPREISQLLSALLAPSPASRPDSAREVVELLAAAGIPLPDPRLADPSARARSAPLAGRDEVLAALTPAWTGAGGGTLFLNAVGPSGSGRSRLAREIARRARLAGRHVVVLDCREEPDAGARLLRASGVGSSAGPWRAGSPGLAVALHALAGRREPTTVVVDDADTLGPTDLSALGRAPAVLPPDANLAVVALTETPLGAGWTTVPLRPLRPAEVGRLVAWLLPGPPVPEAFAARLCRDADGRPGLVCEAVRRAARTGLVRCGPGGWRWGRLEQEPLAALLDEDGAVSRSAEALDAAHRPALLAAATASDAATLDDIAAVAGVPPDTAARSVRALIQAGLVRRTRSGRLRLAGGAAVERRLEELFAGEARRGAHARWLHRLAGLRPPADGRPEWLGRLARHALGCGREELGARLGRRAVMRALLAGRPDTAGAILSRLAPFDGLPDGARAELEEAAGEIHLDAGRADDAARRLGRAARAYRRVGRGEGWARVLARQARALVDTGRPAAARRRIALAERAAAAPSTRAGVALEAGVLAARLQDYPAALARFDEAERHAPPGGLTEARARAARGRCLVLLGRLDEGERELALARRAGARDLALLAAVNLAAAQAARARGAPRRVLELLPETRELLLARGQADGLGILHGFAAEAAVSLGEWDLAVEQARTSVQWRRLQEHSGFLAAALERLAQVHLLRGEIADARAAAERAIAAASAAGPRISAECRATLARILAAEGRGSPAVAAALAAAASAREAGHPETIVETLTAVALARRAAGRKRAARAAVRQALAWVRRLGRPTRFEAELLALLAEAVAEEDPERAVGLAERARAAADRHAAFDAGILALEALGEAHRAAGRPDEARRAWRWAAARIEEASARLASDAARRLARSRPDRKRLLDRAGAAAVPKRLEALYDLVGELNAHRDPSAVVENLLDRALSVLRAERGAVVLRRPGGGLATVCRRGIEPETASDALELSRTVLDRASGGEAVLAADPLSDPRFASALSVRLFSIRAVACVPLRHRGEPVGALYVDSRTPGRRFDEEDIRFLEALAHHAALALENARAFEALRRENEELRAAVGARDRLGPLVGRSAAMQELFRRIRAAAPAGAPVLVLGESGCGKELVARTIHKLGPEPEGPFVPVNCAGLPADLFEATLFGHERGAFTGADRRRVGLVERASGGTLFLDEVGDLPPPMQARLLRVLTEGEVLPLGAPRPRPVSFRLVAATNRDLERLVREGRFRHDLLYRLDVLRIVVPPLRERIEDLPLLVEHIVNRPGFPGGPVEVDRRVVERLAAWHWPGNVRELENTLARLAIHARDGRIGPETLAADPELRSRFGHPDAPPERTRLEEVEREAIRRALELTGGHRERAARLLGIGRATLFRKIRRYGLESAGRAPSGPRRTAGEAPAT
ncbi:MAG: GAF domain-containing protein [Acidobacteria bacterium]|nr:MAG: GAF domain-containing protein [Acidobacteriota bacterium]